MENEPELENKPKLNRRQRRKLMRLLAKGKKIKINKRLNVKENI
tara:strand:+ start:695 stop:826 length:132 start_codon:yes stop_codon:yes gene_type:complete